MPIEKISVLVEVCHIISNGRVRCHNCRIEKVLFDLLPRWKCFGEEPFRCLVRPDKLVNVLRYDVLRSVEISLNESANEQKYAYRFGEAPQINSSIAHCCPLSIQRNGFFCRSDRNVDWALAVSRPTVLSTDARSQEKINIVEAGDHSPRPKLQIRGPKW
jgi:hypothetical protein